MSKLRLELEALVVESFDTAELARAGGTVHANDRDGLIYPPKSWNDTCIGCPQTNEVSCKGTCVTCVGVRTDPCLCDPFEPVYPGIEAVGVEQAFLAD